VYLNTLYTEKIHGPPGAQPEISSKEVKGALAIECQTYTQLVSPAKGLKKKNGGLDNSSPRSL